jgi:hypothetical protein
MSSFNPAPPTRLPKVIWLTRDRVAGVLTTEFEVWGGRPPIREQFADGDAVWLPSALEQSRAGARLLGTWGLTEAMKFAGNMTPTSDVECVRVPPRVYREPRTPRSARPRYS